MSKLLIPVNHTSRSNVHKQRGKKKNKLQKPIKKPIQHFTPEYRKYLDYSEDSSEE